MAKELIYNEDARKKLFAGVEKIARAVRVTLGPNGKLVAVERKDNTPIVSKDGVTIAKSIDLEDPAENLGATITKQSAIKTNDTAGDNTTTSTVLTYAIAKEGLKAIASGFKPINIKRGIDKATNDVINILTKYAKEVSSNEQIKSVATIASNNDEEIGKLIADAIEQIGKDGVIIADDSQTTQTSIQVTKGMQWEEGWLSPYFCTNRERLETEFKNTKILITDKKISTIEDIIPVLDPIAKTGGSLVIVCDDCDGNAMQTLVLNAIQGTIKVAVVKAPSYGENRQALLEDMAILTGGTVISDTYNTNLRTATVDMLGTCDIKITKNITTITNGNGTKEAIDARANMLKSQIENADIGDYDKGKIKKRLAVFTGGIAVIMVGGSTQAEVSEKKYRIDDTIAATRCALDEGILPGGGVALTEASRELCKNLKVETEEDRGYQILLNAIIEPLKQIINNADESGDVVYNNIVTKNVPNYGYNSKTGEYGDMFDFGVIDTCKAIKSALINAASAAGTLLMVDCVATNIEEKNPQPMLMQTPMGPMPY